MSEGDNWTYMAGTEGTGTYVVIGRIPLGGKIGARIGIRALGGGRCRVRIEPENVPSAEALAPMFPRWLLFKQPGDGEKPRFSHEFGSNLGVAMVEAAIRSLELTSGTALERNKARQAHTWREMFRR